MPKRKLDVPAHAHLHAHTTTEAEPLKTTAPAVVRAVNILDVIAASSEPVGLADLARETGVPKSTLHGLCDTLVKLRLVKRHANGGMTMGSYVMGWANAFLSQTNITEEFRAVWEDSRAFAQETVTLSVLDGAEVIYLACHNGNRPLGVTFRIGMRLPAPYTATGKAMLSTLPAHEVADLLAGAWPAPLTKASVATYPALSEEMAQVRRDGYSIDNGQMREGMICFGAPVFDASGEHAVAGLAVSFLTNEIDAVTGERIGRQMRELADQLSMRLGAPARR
ncbi:Transcriptional repressor IclR [Pandoraea iniqua]|uniref:IclR family transcriptional regulator n=1 Tax=Pandoraea iniqua TaxID=2508288 RepID=UPI00123EF282|nr:IclR family transcriptional regulator [Pandoraea iniqua]VVE45231.1 Transcriptional repressor IclR [Pandoraea iniqua]